MEWKDIKTFTMIEYPGFVVNVSKAEQTLGGIEIMRKIIDSDKDRLQLRFRIAEPLSHPAYGDRVNTKCLLIKIIKKKQKQPITESDTIYTSEVVGLITKSFRFNCLAEFQWLPMVRNNSSSTNLENQQKSKSSPTNKPTKPSNDTYIKVNSSNRVQELYIPRTEESKFPRYRSVIEESLPIKNTFDDSVKTLNSDCPLLVLPAVFSRFDTPRETVQQPPKFRSKEMRDEFERQQNLSIIGRTRKKRATMSYRINFKDEVPNEPPKRLTEERSTLSKEETIALPKLKERFETQQVWAKSALCYDIGCSSSDIKYILPLVAFHYITGPFRTMWVKYGYNPHEDKSSKILQTLDFRVKQVCGRDDYDLNDSQYSRRSIHQYQLPLKRGVDKSKSKTHINLNTIEMFKFRRDLRPPARQMSYQLKDIEVDEIQALVHANDGDEPNECSEKDGWLPEGTINQIRKLMNDISIKMFPNAGDSMLSYDSVDPGSPLVVEYE